MAKINYTADEINEILSEAGDVKFPPKSADITFNDTEGNAYNLAIAATLGEIDDGSVPENPGTPGNPDGEVVKVVKNSVSTSTHKHRVIVGKRPSLNGLKAGNWYYVSTVCGGLYVKIATLEKLDLTFTCEVPTISDFTSGNSLRVRLIPCKARMTSSLRFMNRSMGIIQVLEME